MAEVEVAKGETVVTQGAAGLPAPLVLGPLAGLVYLIAISLLAVPALILYLCWRLVRRLQAT